MRTRNNADTPKSAAAKKTPPTKKPAAKTPPNPSEPVSEIVTPKSTGTKRTAAIRSKQSKTNQTTPTATTDLNPQFAVEEMKVSTGAVQSTPVTKQVSGTKTTKTATRKTAARTRSPASAKAVSRKTPKSGETGKVEIEEPTEKEEEEEEEEIGEAQDIESAKTEHTLVVVKEESARREERISENVEELSKKEDDSSLIVESATKEAPTTESVEGSSKKEDDSVLYSKESLNKEETAIEGEKELLLIVDLGKLSKQEDPSVVANVVGFSENQPSNVAKEGDEIEEKEEIAEMKVFEETVESKNEAVNMEEDTNNESKREANKKPEGNENEYCGKERMDEFGDQEVLEEFGEEERAEDDAIEHGNVAKEGDEVEEKEEMAEMKVFEDTVESKNEAVNMEEDTNNESKREADKKPEGNENEYCGKERIEDFGDQEVLEEFGEEERTEDDAIEHGEEAEALEEERVELNTAAKERKIKKELEIFVGGLERDVVEEDVKKAFENIGDVVEVRLHNNLSTNKYKGYAFVKFATKEQARRALSEMKNPLIRGKRCGTAPIDDNDTLFLGNICNTWTKEAIKRKLTDYGIEGVENITLVADAKHEGLSRGFAFLEFSCHVDAMLAYKRLQKPDVIFGHSERTAKVAFAEPLREPDAGVMSQVKSVFLDGLPLQWGEDRVREQFKSYGEIERVVLARNMSSAKRKDFGFVDFTTHESAVACIDGVNSMELGDGNSKTSVRARLSNPLPKTQAVKGGMCGGFRIGSGGAGSSSRFGRGFGRAAYSFNRGSFQRGRGFYQHGRSQTGRMGFANEYDLDSQYPPFHGRQMFEQGGRRGYFGTPNLVSDGGHALARPDLDRPWYSANDRGHGRHIPPRRQPVYPEEGFNRPFGGRHFDDDRYFYDDNAHGTKRTFYMTDQDYMEPRRLRPRLDYSAPAVSGSRYQDSFGAGGGLYSHDYYGSDHDRGAYSSFYGGDRPYGRGYYY